MLSFTGLSKRVNDSKKSFYYRMIIKSFVLFYVLPERSAFEPLHFPRAIKMMMDDPVVYFY